MLKKIFSISLCAFIGINGLSDISLYGLESSEKTNFEFSKLSEISSDKKSEILINVPKMSQLRVLPTGCESVSATMLLSFYGYDVSVNDFVDKYLEKKEVSEYPDPNSAFVGSPYDNNSYGCFAPCIAKAMNKILKNGQTARAIKAETLENIIEKYIKNGTPVLVWTTMNMRKTQYRKSWKIGYVDENSEYKKGDNFSWPGNEHCVVLVGYNEKDYLVNDPLKEKNKILSYYDKKLFNERYREQGSQIVVIETAEI